MALSGSISKTYGSGSPFTATLSWTATQSIPNNYSDVTATLKVKSNSSYVSTNGWNGISWTITINGNTSAIGTTSHIISPNATITLGSHKVRVYHDANGSKSFGFGWVINYADVVWSGSQLGRQTQSGTGVLNNIPITSKVSLSSSSVNFGSAITIKTNRASSSFTHTATYRFGSTTGTIATKSTAADISWTTPMSLISQIPNTKSGYGTITLTTFSGATQIGTSTANFTLNIVNSQKSTMSLNKSSMNFGETVRFTITKKYSGFTSRLKYNINGEVVITNSTSATTYDWTPTVSLCSRIPNNASTTCTFWIDTYNGTEWIGSTSYTMTLNVPSNIVPSISSAALTEENSAVAGISLGANKFLRGKSVVRVKYNSAGIHGSTITKKEVWFSDITTSSSDNFAINLSSHSGYIGAGRNVTIKVTDSRGRTAEQRLPFEIFNYENPRINSFTARRTDPIRRVNVTKSCSFTSVGTNNTLNYSLSWRRSDGQTGSHPVNHSTNSYNFDGYEESRSYTLTLTISDKFASSSSSATVSTSEILMEIKRDTGLGLGKYHERGLLDIGKTSYMSRGISLIGGGVANNGVLPPGDASTGAYWKQAAFPEGISMWDNYAQSGVTNPPTNDGIIIVKRNGGSAGAINIEWFDRWDNQGLKFYGNVGWNSSKFLGWWKHRKYPLDWANEGDILWSGALGMAANEIVRPSKRITQCPNGWAFFWTAYANGSVQVYDGSYSFVHKSHVNGFAGNGVGHQIRGANWTVISKYLYAYDDRVEGNAANNTAAAGAVLRRVIAW